MLKNGKLKRFFAARKSKKGFTIVETIIACTLTAFLIYSAAITHGFITDNVKTANETALKVENLNMVYSFLLRDAAAATSIAYSEDGFEFENGGYSITYTISPSGEITRQGEKLCQIGETDYFVSGDYLDIAVEIFDFGKKKTRIYIGGGKRDAQI